jgi:3D (Asp-Asp-Asp) domain-containing protein
LLTNASASLAAAAIAILFALPPSADAAGRRPPRPMTMTATAYCLRSTTATGTQVHRGMVAADPRVLPFGSRIHVRGPHVNRTYVVEDSGAAMKGRRIDIYMPTCDEAKRFGRQRVTVTIEHLGTPARTTR